jgi:Protein of unknown function (DUF3102)
MIKPDPIPTIDLPAQIEAEHQGALGAARAAIEHAVACGQLLLQAKAEAGHGGWLAWVDAHLSFGERQAQKYMRLAEHAAELPNANSEFAYSSIHDALKAIRCACDGRGDLDESQSAVAKPIRPAPADTVDLPAKRRFEQKRAEAIERLATRMHDVAGRYGAAAVAKAQNAYQVPLGSSVVDALSQAIAPYDNKPVTLRVAPQPANPAKQIVTITPDMVDPVLRVRGLLEQALRVVEADGAFRESIRDRLAALIDAVKAEGATRPIRLPLQRP